MKMPRQQDLRFNDEFRRFAEETFECQFDIDDEEVRKVQYIARIVKQRLGYILPCGLFVAEDYTINTWNHSDYRKDEDDIFQYKDRQELVDKCKKTIEAYLEAKKEYKAIENTNLVIEKEKWNNKIYKYQVLANRIGKKVFEDKEFDIESITSMEKLEEIISGTFFDFDRVFNPIISIFATFDETAENLCTILIDTIPISKKNVDYKFWDDVDISVRENIVELVAKLSEEHPEQWPLNSDEIEEMFLKLCYPLQYEMRTLLKRLCYNEIPTKISDKGLKKMIGILTNEYKALNETDEYELLIEEDILKNMPDFCK